MDTTQQPLTLTLTIIDLPAPLTGTSKSGNPWVKQPVIGETSGQYPRKVALSLFGSALDKYKHLLQTGRTLTFSIDIESREFNGRWYTDVIAWSVSESVSNASQSVSNTQQGVSSQQQPVTQSVSNVPVSSSTLPF